MASLYTTFVTLPANPSTPKTSTVYTKLKDRISKGSETDLWRVEKLWEGRKLYSDIRITGRHCATSWKVAGSIPDGATGIFHWHNPSGRTTALGSTQPLTEMSTRNVSWGVKAAGAYGWQPCHLHVPIVLKYGRLNQLEPSGPVQGLASPFTLYNSDQFMEEIYGAVLDGTLSYWL